MNWELVAQIAVLALIFCFVLIIAWATLSAHRDAEQKRALARRQFEAEQEALLRQGLNRSDA